MKKIVLGVFLFLFVLPSFAQVGFLFKKEVKKVKIPFQLINNLIFIPLKVNGTELTFMLDSGVEETILFSLEEKEGINLNNTESISLKGLGSNEAIDGLKSSGNQLEAKGMVSRNHLVYVILDQEFNLSSHIGIPVHGIIGYSFFKNNLLEINYANKVLIFHQDRDRIRDKFKRKYKRTAITIEGAKPYVNGIVTVNNTVLPVKLLVDTGHSDAIWLFENKSDKIKVPTKNFDDYLGKGFSGDIYGKRAFISEFSINDFKFENPIAAFPDSVSIKHVKMVTGRLGSVGGEIFKRFSVVFDYKNDQMFLKTNSNFKQYFSYNKSGIEVRHSGMQWVQETIPLQMETKSSASNTATIDIALNNFKYKLQLKPVYEIDNVRPDSAAAQAGLLAGDVLISINNRELHKYTLPEVNSFLKSEKDKWITIVVERKYQQLKFRFQLLNVL